MKTDESEIVFPNTGNAVESPVDQFLHRRKRIHHPDSDEAGVNSSAGLKRDETSMNDHRHTECDPDRSLGSVNCPTHNHSPLPFGERLVCPALQLIAIFLNKSKSLNIFPVPSTTHDSGFSASVTGRPVSSRIRLSRFLISAPPPARTIPRSAISAESSGGVRSKTTRMDDSGKRDHCNFRSAASNVDDHVSRWLR